MSRPSDVVMALFADLRYAFRLLPRSPVFSLTSIVSLAVGIAASNAIFCIADAMLWRARVGVVDPAQVVDIGRGSANSSFDNFSYPLFQALRDRSTIFEGMAAIVFGAEPMSLGDGTSSERVFVGRCRPTTFRCWARGPRTAASFGPTTIECRVSDSSSC